MRGRGIVLLTSALQRYSRASPNVAFSSSSTNTSFRFLSSSLLPSSSLPILDLSSSGSSSANSGGEGRDRPHGGRDRRVGLLAAAGAFSTSFAFSSMSAPAVAKERIAADRLPQEVVLYQYEVCPFCNKVKAFLDYHDIPYRVVEVNPVGKKELKWSDYKKVPVLVVDGEQLNDSTVIMTTLNKQLKKSDPLEAEDNSEEEQWRRWVDDHLVHLLSPNIYRSPTEALEAFGYIAESGNFSTTERVTAKYFGAAAMYFISKRLKKRHNIGDERQDLYEAAECWVKALNGRKFMGGDKPNLADLAVFGVLRPIRNLRSGEDMVANTSIGTWYGNMEEAVGASSRLAPNSQTTELRKRVTVGS
ncbi:unnamed protein product [Calypogeia fissa]